MTKRQLPSPFPLSPPAQTESTHTTKSASYSQNTNCGVPSVYLRSGECRGESNNRSRLLSDH
jgi:hypothetical protein